MTSEPTGTKQVTDLETLKALTHPLRLRLLGALRLSGPSTATQLGRQLGQSSGATSYHLRQLARFGFIEEDPEQPGGRERVWRAAHRTTAWNTADFMDQPAGLEASDALVRYQLGRQMRLLKTWQANRSNADPRWLDAAESSDDVLRLTPSQTRQLKHALDELLRSFRDEAPPPDQPDEPTAYVAAFWQLLPFEELPL